MTARRGTPCLTTTEATRVAVGEASSLTPKRCGHGLEGVGEKSREESACCGNLLQVVDGLCGRCACRALRGSMRSEDDQSGLAKLDEYEKSEDPVVEDRLAAELDTFVEAENDATDHCEVEECPTAASAKYRVSMTVRYVYPEDSRRLCIADASCACFAPFLPRAWACRTSSTSYRTPTQPGATVTGLAARL